MVRASICGSEAVGDHHIGIGDPGIGLCGEEAEEVAPWGIAEVDCDAGGFAEPVE